MKCDSGGTGGLRKNGGRSSRNGNRLGAWKPRSREGDTHREQRAGQCRRHVLLRISLIPLGAEVQAPQFRADDDCDHRDLSAPSSSRKKGLRAAFWARTTGARRRRVEESSRSGSTRIRMGPEPCSMAPGAWRGTTAGVLLAARLQGCGQASSTKPPQNTPRRR